MSFQYPPLPSSDGLRILTLAPSKDFSAPLEGTLTSVPFSAKPRFVALSYTWSDRDADHGALPLPAGTSHINLGDQRLRIGHNLVLALHYARSDVAPLHLWADQICINQADVAERNAQVSLMAFIYGRATAVVAWMGVSWTGPVPIQWDDPVEYMSFIWQRGRGKQLTGYSTAPSSRKSGGSRKAREGEWQPTFSDMSSSGTPDMLQGNPYWQRMWIVQEVCIPRTIVFLHGDLLWSQEQIVASLRGRSSSVANATLATSRLLSTRNERFSDAMRLEALIEKFRESGCSELRDRVYGMVGLANDAESVATADHKSSDSAVRGRGIIRIDYNRSFYNIWCDVVSFMLFQAKPLNDFGYDYPEQLRDERRTRVVRFAGVVQNAFEGKVSDEVLAATSSTSRKEQLGQSPEFIVTKGYIGGRVLHVGPKYSDFVGSYSAEKEWIGSWNVYYQREDDLEKLRKMEAAYAASIVRYTDADTARIVRIHSPCTAAWRAVSDWMSEGPDAAMLHKTTTDPAATSSTRSVGGQEPVRFLGSQHCMGLAPAGTQPGDIVVRFWNCDAAVVLRELPEETVGDPGSQEVLAVTVTPLLDFDDDMNDDDSGELNTVYGLVGCADIAEPFDREGGQDFVGRDSVSVLRGSDGTLHDRSGFHSGSRRAMYMRTDFETLQMITADITT